MANKNFSGKYNIIEPLKSVEDWRDFFIATLDTETYRHKLKSLDSDVIEEQLLAICDIYDGANHKLLYNPKEIESYITDLSKAHPHLIIFAHNYLFDSKIIGLVERAIIDNEYANLPLKTKMLDSIFYLKASNVERRHRKGFKSSVNTKNERTIEFIDSYNFFKAPLKELLHSFNAKKYADEETYGLDSDQWNKWLDTDNNKEKLVQSDTEGLYDFLKVSLPLLPKAISAPSSVFKLFRYKYLHCNISIPKYVNDFAEKSYRGGRVEAYLLSKNDREINYYDFNSLYPYVMRKYKYAWKFDKETHLTNQEIYDNVREQKYDYLLEVSYSFPKDKKRLPIVIKVDGKLKQKLTASKIWLTGIEFNDCIDESASITVHKQFQFEVRDLFGRYVDDFYYLKKNAKNEVEKNIYKLYLNSFYGKFGQHRRVSEFMPIQKIPMNWKEIIRAMPQKTRITIEENGQKTVITNYGNYVSFMKPMEITYNSMIASEVTAYARHENWLMQKELGIENVIYTDTDSFVTTKEHRTGKELGELKLEYEGKIRIYNPKHYTIRQNGKVVKDSEKGIPKKAIRNKDGSVDFQSFGRIKDGWLDRVVIHKKHKKEEIESDKLRYVEMNNGEKEGLPFE